MKTENAAETGQKIKILYISPRDMLKARSDPIHIMASCKWFRRSGADVELLAPYYKRPENISEKDMLSTYGIAEGDRFLVTHLPTRLTDDASPSAVRIQKFIMYGWDAIKRFLIQREYRKYDRYIVFSKCYFSFLPLYFLKKALRLKNVIFVFEAAAFQNRSHEIKILRKFSRIVAIHPSLKADIAEAAGIPAENIVVPVHGVDDAFAEDMQISKAEARRMTGISEKAFLAVYSGKVYIGENSEVAMIMRTAKLLPDVSFVFTGGKKEAVDYFRTMAERLGIANTMFTGFFASPSDTFPYLSAADVLLSFYPKNVPTLKYMGPNKIIQYARSRNVIVSAKYPAIENMVGEDGALFLEPENVEALALAINKVKTGAVDAAAIAERAYEKIKVHSYEQRTQDILNFVMG